MIFKLQRPLAGSDMSNCLAYNEDRSEQLLVPFDDQARELFTSQGWPKKLYVHAYLSNNRLVIRGITNSQEW